MWNNYITKNLGSIKDPYLDVIKKIISVQSKKSVRLSTLPLIIKDTISNTSIFPSLQLLSQFQFNTCKYLLFR